MFHKIAASLLVVIAMAGCTKKPDQALVILFEQTEPDVKPYMQRLIVSDAYLRFDDGADNNDFLLFDRKAEVIYSSNADDQRILVIKRKPRPQQSPMHLKHKTVAAKDKLPNIDNKAVTHYSYLTNDQLCFDVFAAKGLLPKARHALIQYADVLAGEQSEMLSIMPAEMQSPCDLANNIFAADRHLKDGFPIRQQDMLGRVRELMSYSWQAPQAAWFVLPEGYKHFTTEDMRAQTAPTG